MVELIEQRNWCLAIIRFMKELGAPSDSFVKFEEIVNAAYERGDRRALKSLSRDIAEWSTGMKVSDQQDLDEFLRSRFGRGLTDTSQTARREVTKVLRRGKIEGKQEYRLLMRRVNEICADESKKNELEQINVLLARFENA